MKACSVLLVCILLACRAEGQEDSRKWAGTGVEANFWTGKVIRHTPKFKGELPRHPYAVQLNILKKTYGQKDWHQRRNYPVVGMGGMFINYSKPDVYGQVFGIYPLVYLPIWKSEQLEVNASAGMGVGYVTKHYERAPKPNFSNTFIGGHWNNVSPFTLNLKWRIDEHWELQTGLNFVHVSNASLQRPNLGINMAGVHGGLRYSPVTNRPATVGGHSPALSGRTTFSLRYGMAFIEQGMADGPLFPVYLVSVFANKRYWSKNKAFVGVDYAYNTATYLFLRSIEAERGKEAAGSTQIAGFIGNEFLLGRVGVSFQLGVYFKELYGSSHLFYQKLGGHLYLYQSETGIVKELSLTVLLKTHLSVAEFSEVGIGIGF